MDNSAIMEPFVGSSTGETSLNSQPALMGIQDTKAGMVGLDKERINRIIHEASRNSPFFKNKQDQQEKIDAKIKAMINRVNEASNQDRKVALNEMDAIALELEEKRRDLSKIIVHVDMDIFYAAVHIRENPSLAEKPMAVGSMSMLATSNYVARKFGVRAGMAGFIGKKLCPSLIIIKHEFKKYIEASNKVMQVIEKYDPKFSTASLDEAYLDITEYVKAEFVNAGGTLDLDVFGAPIGKVFPESVWDLANEIVGRMRQEVFEATKLTCSAGIAHNKVCITFLCSCHSLSIVALYLRCLQKCVRISESQTTSL